MVLTYLKQRTDPLKRGNVNTGFETLIGLKLNLQPNDSKQSLKNEAEMIGL